MNAPRILVTRELDELSEILAKKMGLDIVVEPMIRIEFAKNTKELAAQISAADYDAIAFTSQNAVRAFSEIIFREKIKVPEVKFFAIGDSTARHLKLLDVEPLVPAQNDAVHLADMILNDRSIRTVLFPCAEHHLEDLPEWLRRQKVEVKEMIVYSTIQLKKKVETKGIDAIAFMSPSAVKSFFAANKETNSIPCFAIGRTTAEEVKRSTSNPVFVADKPDVKSIFEKVAAYFSKIGSP
ncbi:MAG TPA: uroporphyrinogen-III synthase [Chitinophagales bacterium]|nr:uroporphyrinogen-III synthase [Chitinophagales bacterium]